MVSTRATGELHIGEIQAILQQIYPGVEVAGDTGGESTGPHADTALSREELCAQLASHPPPSPHPPAALASPPASIRHRPRNLF